MLVVAASHLVEPTDVVVVGLGLPQLAAVLAQRAHAPDVVLLLEIGVFAPQVRGAAMGIADPRMWEGSTSFGGMLDVLGYMLHGQRVTLGILGALQVDRYGSVNSSMVKALDGTPRRFLGSGGANDIASMSQRVLVVMEHQPRKFCERVDFLTSPGHRLRGRSRAEVGLPGWGTATIVTDRAVIDIEEQGPVLHSIHPGEDIDRLLADTPIAMAEPSRPIRVTIPPTTEELRLIRGELDPQGWYTR
jgi:glutaconate CoA-transferase subunit B